MTSTSAPTAEQSSPRQSVGAGAGETVASLRDLSRTDPHLAQLRAWSEIKHLGIVAGRDRRGASEELNAMFRLGSPPESLDGDAEGILVTPLIQPIADRIVRAVGALWMPWVGKRLNASEATGANVLSKAGGIAARLVWPRHAPDREATGRSVGFRFDTRLEPGRLDPDVTVMAIDYDSPQNPGFVIRSVRDELVEIVPSTYLGKMLYRRGSGADDRWRLIGYFALRAPLPYPAPAAPDAGDTPPQRS